MRGEGEERGRGRRCDGRALAIIVDMGIVSTGTVRTMRGRGDGNGDSEKATGAGESCMGYLYPQAQVQVREELKGLSRGALVALVPASISWM